MALRYLESFDGLATADMAAKGWTLNSFAGSFVTLNAASGRNSTQAMLCPAGLTNASRLMLATPHATGIVGVAVMPQTVFVGNSTFDFIRIIDIAGGVTHLTLTLDSSNRIVCNRGASTVLGTGATVLNIGAFVYVEFKFTIHDSAGAVEVRLNGSSSAEISASGIDTRNGGNATWDTLTLAPGYNGTFRFDDLYVCDGSGSAPANTFLGDCRVECLVPQTDAVSAGSNAGLTCSTGTDHGALVDDATPNGDTDYNSSATVGVKDTYQFPSLSTSPTAIYGVQVNPYVKKTDAGAKTFCPVVRSGGTDYDGTTQTPTTSYAFYPQVYEQDPNTSAAWDLAGIAAVQVGVKVVS